MADHEKESLSADELRKLAEKEEREGVVDQQTVGSAEALEHKKERPS